MQLLRTRDYPVAPTHKFRLGQTVSFAGEPIAFGKSELYEISFALPADDQGNLQYRIVNRRTGQTRIAVEGLLSNTKTEAPATETPPPRKLPRPRSGERPDILPRIRTFVSGASSIDQELEELLLEAMQVIETLRRRRPQ